jgi:hypothetical protein
VPPGAEAWVDEIRQIGNDANHEIFEIDPTQAKSAVDFASMLLKLLYEFPARGNASGSVRTSPHTGGTAQRPPRGRRRAVGMWAR